SDRATDRHPRSRGVGRARLRHLMRAGPDPPAATHETPSLETALRAPLRGRLPAGHPIDEVHFADGAAAMMTAFAEAFGGEWLAARALPVGRIAQTLIDDFRDADPDGFGTWMSRLASLNAAAGTSKG